MKNVFDLFADNKPIGGVDSCVSGIKNTVNVFTKQDAVRFGVCPALRVRTNVCRIQSRKNLSASQGTLTPIELRDRYSKRALPQPRHDQDGLTISGLLF